MSDSFGVPKRSDLRLDVGWPKELENAPNIQFHDKPLLVLAETARTANGLCPKSDCKPPLKQRH